MCVQEDLTAVRKYYNFFYSFNFIIGCVFFLGYYGVIDNLVTICFGENLELSKAISLSITLNYFVQFMRQATLLFRDATGTFYFDRWKDVIEAVVNVGLSIAFVYLFRALFGEDYAVVGVIVATIFTNLFICHIVEPYVLFKHALKCPVKGFFVRNYACIALFTAALLALHLGMVSMQNEWLELLVNGCMAVGIAIIPCLIVALSDKDFRYYCKIMAKRIFRRGKSKEQ